MGRDTTRLQLALKAEGFDPKGVDGIRGPNTREALRQWSDQAATQLHGIDVSHYQTKIDWEACKKAGVSFVAIRASVSVYLDKLFLQHSAGAKAAGIPRAAYHFLAPWQDGIKQAQLIASRLAQNGTELPVVLDVEAVAPSAKKGEAPPTPVSRAQLIDRAGACLHEIEKLTDRKPIFYSYSAFVRQYRLWEAFGGYPLWIADYREGPPTVPVEWPWVFHQYAGDGGRQVGVTGPCDLNRSKHTIEQLAAL